MTLFSSSRPRISQNDLIEQNEQNFTKDAPTYQIKPKYGINMGLGSVRSNITGFDPAIVHLAQWGKHWCQKPWGAAAGVFFFRWWVQVHSDECWLYLLEHSLGSEATNLITITNPMDAKATSFDIPEREKWLLFWVVHFSLTSRNGTAKSWLCFCPSGSMGKCSLYPTQCFETSSSHLAFAFPNLSIPNDISWT